MRTVSTATLVVAALLSTACVRTRLPLGFAVEIKTVAAKSGNNLLHATDGSTCRVSRATFQVTKLHEVHTCVWGPGDRGPGAPLWAQPTGGRLQTRAPVLRPKPPR